MDVGGYHGSIYPEPVQVLKAFPDGYFVKRNEQLGKSLSTDAGDIFIPNLKAKGMTGFEFQKGLAYVGILLSILQLPVIKPFKFLKDRSSHHLFYGGGILATHLFSGLTQGDIIGKKLNQRGMVREDKVDKAEFRITTPVNLLEL